MKKKKFFASKSAPEQFIIFRLKLKKINILNLEFLNGCDSNATSPYRSNTYLSVQNLAVKGLVPRELQPIRSQMLFHLGRGLFVKRTEGYDWAKLCQAGEH